MYDKINLKRKALMKGVYLRRAIIIFAIIGLILIFISLAELNEFERFFVYPEKDYQLSEKVAEEIAQNHDVLSKDFDSDHKVTITLYDPQNKFLNLDVQEKNSRVSVGVHFVNYGDSNQQYTIVRKGNNLGHFGFYVTSFTSIFLATLLIVMILLGIYMLLINIFGFVCWIIHKFIKHN